MPNASISVEPVKYELKTCEGGYVVIKRMPYGKWLKRSEMSLEMKAQQQKGSRSTDLDISLMNLQVTLFEFSTCIVDHNLEDETGNKLDFKNAVSFELLDPRIGNEIAGYISELHEFESGN